MATVSINLDGWQQAINVLGLIPDEFHPAALDEAIAVAARPVRRAFKKTPLFSDRTGNLRKVIKIKRTSKGRRGRNRRFTDLELGDTLPRAAGGVFYAHFVDQGTKNHRTGKPHAPPTNFIEKTLNESEGQFADGVIKFIASKGMESAIKASRKAAGLPVNPRRQRR